jgi:hypothetical protein
MLARKNKIYPIDQEPKEPKEPKEPRQLTFKVSPKKAISIYGLQRFPVTLYKDQWITLIDNLDNLRDFIKEHETELATKDPEP